MYTEGIEDKEYILATLQSVNVCLAKAQKEFITTPQSLEGWLTLRCFCGETIRGRHKLQEVTSLKIKLWLRNYNIIDFSFWCPDVAKEINFIGVFHLIFLRN